MEPETLLENLTRRWPQLVRMIEHAAAHGSTADSAFAIRLLELLLADTKRRVWTDPRRHPDRELP